MFGFTGAGALYAGHTAIGVSTLACLGLVLMGVLVRFCLIPDPDTESKRGLLLRRSTTPREAQATRTMSDGVTRTLLIVGGAFLSLLWLGTHVGLLAGWLKPADGCGWALKA